MRRRDRACPLREMRSGWKYRRESPAMRRYPLVVIRFQEIRRLFLPNYFVVLSNAGNKAKQAVIAVKREGPNSVIRYDRQVSLNKDRLTIRGRCSHQSVSSTWNSESLSRLKHILRWSDCCRQTAIDKCVYSSPLSHSYFPQEARGHYVSDLHISIIGNAELR
jgi:hypothetical protein